MKRGLLLWELVFYVLYLRESSACELSINYVDRTHACTENTASVSEYVSAGKNKQNIDKKPELMPIFKLKTHTLCAFSA